MRSLSLILSATFIVSTLLALVQAQAWWIRILDFPRPQLVVLGLVSLILYGLKFGDSGIFGHVLAATTVLCIVIQAVSILPYTAWGTKQVLSVHTPDRARTVSLVASNVRMSNRDYQRFLNVVRDQGPDLVLMTEVDSSWLKGVSALRADYPYRIEHPQDDTYGMALYSKLKLEDGEVRFLVDDDVPSIRANVRLPSGEAFVFIGVHPRPPRPDRLQDSTQRDGELVLIGHEVRHQDLPVVVAGDLNDVAWSHTTRLFQRIGGLVDPRRGRGLLSTYHAQYPLLRYPIDHVFHSNEFRLGRMERLADVGSDHFPILVELSYEPAASALQEPEEADEEDIKEAAAKMMEAL